MTKLPLTRSIPYEADLRTTCYPLLRGTGDPTMKLRGALLARASLTPIGPAELHVRSSGGDAHAEAWGRGAPWVLEYLPELIGAHDDPPVFDEPGAAKLQRAVPGFRLTRTGLVLEALVPAVIEQKVTGREAWRSFRTMVTTWGQPAPGPAGLWVQPPAERLASEPYFNFHLFGIERKRAETLRAVCTEATHLASSLDGRALRRRLLSVRGIGEWTAAEVRSRALGDPDAVSVGDYNLPHLVTWALAGEERGTDARMLELLEPYRGQRNRVVRLIEAMGIRPPRHGPRLAARKIAGT